MANHHRRRNMREKLEPGGSGGYLRLNPGKVLSQSINVSKLYEIRRAGTYLIQVQRLDPETKTFVKSNEIKVTIAPITH
jgi:hypothetical protein